MKTALIAGAVALGLMGSYAWAADVRAGERKYVLCAGCHGPSGAGNEALRYPRLAGRDAKFIATQLRLFKSGSRNNATMKAMTAGLNEQDIDNLAAYIATFK